MININPWQTNRLVNLGNALRRHPSRTLLFTAMIAAATGSVLALVLPHSREIVYDMRTVFALCPASDACAARVELLIGNTGQAPESVKLIWPDYQGNWTHGERLLNISADQPRSRDPLINCAGNDGRRECAIEQFTPGTLVILHMDCYRCSREQVQRLADTPLLVETQAYLAHGDPRVAVFSRRLLAFIQLF